MKILSLFDGISCGQMALHKAQVKYSHYYASEINKQAIQLTQHNFPSTIQLGDATKINFAALPAIDLLIGGSPCQGFSINGNRLNFDDPRSRLVFDFIDARDRLKPKYWLLENVATMSAEIKLLLDDYLGVYGRRINSNNFSAQNRKRVYWTNIPILPAKRRTFELTSLLEDHVPDNYLWAADKIAKQKILPTITDGVITLNPKQLINRQTFQQDRIYSCRGLFPALTATLGNRFNIRDQYKRIRRLTIREQARLQTMPDSYDFSVVTDRAASHAIGNGWTVDVIAHIFKGLK